MSSENGSKPELFLELLKTDAYTSGETLAQKGGISRSAVWKQIRLLRRYGYTIESLHGKGYKLAGKTDSPVPWELAKGLQTSFVGKRLTYKEVIESTQNLAISLAASKQRRLHGLVIIAEQQKNGRGRLKRKWLSPRGGLWLSTILEPSIPTASITLLPLMAALAVCDSIREITKLDARLKWPNDVMISGKKVAGILLDVSAEAEQVNYAVIGIGINANVEASLISSHLEGGSQTITSIRDELGHDTNRLELTQRLLEKLEQYYLEMESDARSILQKWKERSDILGRQITVTQGKNTIKGIALDISDDGVLLLSRDNNDTISITSGDIHVRY